MEQGDARRRTLYLSLVALAVLYLAYLARAAVLPLAIALLLAYILAPVVSFLERRGVSRLGSVVILFVAFFGSTTLGLVFGIPPVVEQGKALVRAAMGEPSLTVGVEPPEDLLRFLERQPAPAFEAYLMAREALPGAPEGTADGNWERRLREAREARGEDGARDLRQRVSGWRVTLHEGRAVAFEDVNRNGALDPGYILDYSLKTGRWVRERLRTPGVAAIVEDLGTDGLKRLAEEFLTADAARGALGLLGSLLLLLSWCLIVPLYTFYFLMRLEDVWKAFVTNLPGSYRDRVVAVLLRIHRMLIGFFRGRLLTMLLKGLYVAFGLAMIGAPFWPVFGAAAGLLTIVPAVGPLAAGVPAALLAYREGGPWIGGMAAAWLLSAELIEGYVLIPRIIGKEVGLHPMAVITSILIGGALLGMFGVVIAIPLAAAAKIVWAEFVVPALRAKAAEPPRPPGQGVV